MVKAFTDTRVFVCQATDPNSFVELQECSGPRYIMVGANVTNERLQRHAPEISRRYGVTLEELQQARDGGKP